MAKRAAKPKMEIIEVRTPKVDNVIKLDEVIDQLAKKAGGVTSRGARTTRAGSDTQDRLARIKELSAELAQELRALRQSPAGRAKASATPRKRSK